MGLQKTNAFILFPVFIPTGISSLFLDLQHHCILDPVDQFSGQLLGLKFELLVPVSAYRTAERAATYKVEQKPECVETVAAHELCALVMRLTGLDDDLGVLLIVWRRACVDGEKAQRAEFVVRCPACFQRPYLRVDRLGNSVVLQCFLQKLDDPMLALDDAMAA